MKSAKSKAQGICYLAGAGPGDLGLVTLKVKEVVEQAEVIVYDYLCNPEILDVGAGGRGDHLRGQKGRAAHAEAGGDQRAARGEDARGQAGGAAEGRRSVSLRARRGGGGGAGGGGAAFRDHPRRHLGDRRAGLRGHPGDASRAHRRSSPFSPGTKIRRRPESSLDFAHSRSAPGTKVMLMGVERIGAITETLMRARRGAGDAGGAGALGHDGPAADAARARSRTSRRRWRRPASRRRRWRCSAMSWSLRDELNWFETRPLFGKRIVVTRTRQQAGGLERRAARRSARMSSSCRPSASSRRRICASSAELVQDAHTYDWLIFTSPNGVNAFFEMFYQDFQRRAGDRRRAHRGDRPGDGGAGEGVSSCTWICSPRNSWPRRWSKAFKKDGSVENQQHPPRAGGAGAGRPAEGTRRKLGAIVDEAIAYRTVPETETSSGGIGAFPEEGADLITFTSSSTVENFSR